jgi:hypothetical protein
MYQTNPTEIFRERHLALLREAGGRRLVRRLRKAHAKGHPRSEPHVEPSWLRMLWSTGPVP